ncbi:sugar kinase [Streptomyces axinellae]|uniref:Sugar kinase n=1 Tax=Streptomyces axinellae TaxID=552788 RepID=A0ABN3QLA6_9ACTN
MTTTPDVDVVCLGESMVTFLPSRPGPLADVPSFDRSIGGAESNVACALAHAGYRTRWVSRVGDDGFGDHLVRTIAGHGVDTTAVERDPVRPTGIYFRTDAERPTGHTPAGGGTEDGPGTGPRTEPGTEPGTDPRTDPRTEPGTDPRTEPPALSEVLYYRAGSAASAMSPTNVAPAALGSGRVLHLTGITAALSADCLALMRALTEARGGSRRGPLVSFDVNYRVSLWRAGHGHGNGHGHGHGHGHGSGHGDRPGPRVLLELARHSDLVFVGEDEAAAAWGMHGGPEAVRAALPEPAVLVVKQGSAGATAFVGDEPGVFAPALRVDVVSPVGAGDAFAAGFLAGTLRGLPVRERLRHGHLMAAAALTAAGDLAPPAARERADALVALDAEAWDRLRLGPGWTARGPENPEKDEPEVRSA